MYNAKSRINFFGEGGIQMLISHQISRSDFQISRALGASPASAGWIEVYKSIQIKPTRRPPPSIWTVGKNGRKMYWSIERSSAVGGRYPPSSAVGGRNPLIKNDEIKPSVREIIRL